MILIGCFLFSQHFASWHLAFSEWVFLPQPSQSRSLKKDSAQQLGYPGRFTNVRVLHDVTWCYHIETAQKGGVEIGRHQELESDARTWSIYLKVNIQSAEEPEVPNPTILWHYAVNDCALSVGSRESLGFWKLGGAMEGMVELGQLVPFSLGPTGTHGWCLQWTSHSFQAIFRAKAAYFWSSEGLVAKHQRHQKEFLL